MIFTISIIFFLWSNFLNRGSLSISADAPFKVSVLGDQQIDCAASPCKITTKIGQKDLLLEKDGFSSELIQAEVKLFRNTNLEVSFSIIPYIEAVESIPTEDPVFFELPVEITFPNSLQNPQVIANDKAALVVTPQASYRVNFTQESRKRLNTSNLDITNIEDGKWSSDGRNLAFTLANSSDIWLLNSQDQFVDLGLLKNQTIYSWSSDKLFFLSRDSQGLVFLNFYDPQSADFGEEIYFDEIVNLPTELVAGSNGHRIYFRDFEGQNAVIFLEKF